MHLETRATTRTAASVAESQHSSHSIEYSCGAVERREESTGEETVDARGRIFQCDRSQPIDRLRLRASLSLFLSLTAFLFSLEFHIDRVDLHDQFSLRSLSTRLSDQAGTSPHSSPTTPRHSSISLSISSRQTSSHLPFLSFEEFILYRVDLLQRAKR